MKLALILDKSDSFIAFERDRILASWDTDETRDVGSMSEVGETSLFGDSPVSLMVLKDSNDVKKVLEYFDNVSTEKLNEKLSGGLIMFGAVNRNSTRRLESLVSSLGGDVVLSKANSKDRTNIVEKLLQDTALSREVKRFIVDYSGDQYDSMLSFIRGIGALSERQQRLITVDDVILRTPQSPGSVPPWEVEEPLMKSDVAESITAFRRIVKHSHPLVVISVLKTKMSLAYRVAALREAGITSLPQIAGVLGVPNTYPLKLANGTASRLGLKKLEKVLRVVASMESNAKGGSSSDLNAMTEAGLVDICILLASKVR